MCPHCLAVPPEKPRIFSDRGKEVRLKLGPYQIGEDVRLRCEAVGGRPLARVTWWRDHALLDDSFQVERDKVKEVALRFFPSINLIHFKGEQRAGGARPAEERPAHHLHLPGVQQQHLRPRLHLRQARHAV